MGRGDEFAIIERSSDNQGVRVHSVEWAPTVATEALPLVLLPGGLGSAWQWEEEAVAATRGRYGGRPRRFVGVDRRGLGGSDAPEYGYSQADFASDVAAVVEDMRLDRFVLAGNSYGVPIALEYALSSPARVAALLLLDHPARTPPRNPPFLADMEAGWIAYADWDEAFADTPHGGALRFSHRGLARPDFARLAHRWFKQLPDGTVTPLWRREFLRPSFAEYVATSYWERLPALECPVLVVGGTERSALSRDDAERYRGLLRNGTVAIIDGADHGLTVGRDDAPLHGVIDRFFAANRL